MQTATALSLGEPLQEPMTPVHVLTDRLGDVMTGLFTHYHMNISSGSNLCNIQATINYAREALELLECIQVHVRG